MKSEEAIMRTATIRLYNLNHFDKKANHTKRDKLLAAYHKDGELISTVESETETIYTFKMYPVKQKKIKPCVLSPVFSGTDHDTYNRWREKTRTVCTCLTKSFSTSSTDHDAGCKAQAVIQAGGFA